MDPTKLQDVSTEATKAAPAAGASVYGWLHGLDWAALVAPATLAYIALQCAYLLWRWRRDRRREEAGLPPVTELADE